MGGYKWIDPNDFCSNKCSNNSTKGYVLEADLEYPKESHELHNDYPSAPVKQKSKKNVIQISIIIFLSVTLRNWCLTFLINKKDALHCENF